MLSQHPPEGVSLHPDRWREALDLLRGWCDAGKIPGAGLVVGRAGRMIEPQFLGRMGVESEAAPLSSDTLFLIASITKPVVALGVLRLAEQGRLMLDDRVEEYIPEFGRAGTHLVTIRNLLTHTSGLPDMLPDNFALRGQHAPLSRFVEGACQIELSFPPGRGVQYQSLGFALLGEIIQRVSGMPASEFLRRELFEPLGMHDTALGAPDTWYAGAKPKIGRVARIRLPEEMQGTDWNWNSRYWQQLGVPWGGLITSPADLAKLALMLLSGGRVQGERLLSPATIQAATRNQLAEMPDVPEVERRCRPWGLGWRLNWPAHSANFGDFLGTRTYGHWGATGTLMWLDPETQSFLILLTTQPQEPRGNYLARFSNAALGAWE